MKIVNYLVVLLILCFLSTEVFGQFRKVFQRNYQLPDCIATFNLVPELPDPAILDLEDNPNFGVASFLPDELFFTYILGVSFGCVDESFSFSLEYQAFVDLYKITIDLQPLEDFGCICTFLPQRCLQHIVDCYHRRLKVNLQPYFSYPISSPTILVPPIYGMANVNGDSLIYTPDVTNPALDSIVIQNCDSNGCEVITFNIENSYEVCPTVPTLSEWKKIFLFLLLLCIGTLGIQKMSLAQVIQLTAREPRRCSAFYLSTWLVILLLVLVFYQEILLRDILMALLTAIPVTLIALVGSEWGSGEVT